MKTLRNLEVVGGLFRGEATQPAMVWDAVRLYLDTAYNSEFPASIDGNIVNINNSQYPARMSYDIIYNESSLTGASFLKVEDVTDYLVIAGDSSSDLAVETGARIAGDAVTANLVVTEAALRVAAVTSEATARAASDATLTTSITTEVSARIAESTTVAVASYVSGNTLTLAPLVNRFNKVNFSATAAAFTILFPSAANSVNGQVHMIRPSHAVTALTASAGSGTTIDGTLSAMESKVTYSWIYTASDTTWNRL